MREAFDPIISEALMVPLMALRAPPRLIQLVCVKSEIHCSWYARPATALHVRCIVPPDCVTERNTGAMGTLRL